jgi:hypothetical protein
LKRRIFFLFFAATLLKFLVLADRSSVSFRNLFTLEEIRHSYTPDPSLDGITHVQLAKDGSVILVGTASGKVLSFYYAND